MIKLGKNLNEKQEFIRIRMTNLVECVIFRCFIYGLKPGRKNKMYNCIPHEISTLVLSCDIPAYAR